MELNVKKTTKIATWINFSPAEWRILVNEAARNNPEILSWEDGCTQLTAELNAEGVFIPNIGELW